MKKLIIAVVLTVAAVGCTAQAAEQGTEPVSYDDGSGVTAEMVVDFAGPSMTAEFCDVYEQVGSYDVAFAAFEDGYGYNETPSAEEVFDEILSRC